MASDSITVRIIQEEDMPALVEIDAMVSGSPRADYLRGKARQALDSENGTVISLVAVVGGRVVGFLMGQVLLGEFGIHEHVATVDTVDIHPESQVEGAARLLMEEFVSHARKVGIKSIRTMVNWSQWDLIGFFRAVGFAPGTTIVLERKI